MGNSMNAWRCWPLGLVLLTTAAAQDLVQVAPAIATVEYDDAAIRVIRSHYEPGTRSPMHAHPPRIVIGLLPGTLRLSKPDGSSVVAPPDPQQRPLALPAETHAVENIGATPAENFEIEFKQQAQFGALRATPAERGDDARFLLREPHHHWLMETPYFRIVEARIPAGETTQWHRHRHSNVGIRIEGGRVSVQKQGGEWSPPANFASGSVTFERVDAPFVHRVRNVGTNEYHVIMVELLDPGAK
jgi:quercetin dioxygenase-like cupin family protein